MMVVGSSNPAGSKRPNPLRPQPVVGKRGERFDHPDVAVSVPSVEVELWCGPARVKNRDSSAGWRATRRKRPKLQRWGSLNLILPNSNSLFSRAFWGEVP